MKQAAVSFSHREECGAVVVAPGPVGVDLELRHSIPPRQLRYFAHASEQTSLRGADPTVLWVLKEAVWKALRLGNDVPFKALRLEFANCGRLVAVRLGRARYRARALLTYPWPGYVLAVVRLERAGGAGGGA
jgi:phosphopantetheinyl transferase